MSSYLYKSLTLFSLYKEFTALRQDPEYAWLQEYSCKSVRYVLKYLADAYQACFQGQRGYPAFKRKHAHQDGFTIPDQVQVGDHQLYVPRIGWLRLKGSNLYAHGQPVQARIRQEGSRARPKWYVYLTYAVPADSVRCGAATGMLGLDRNVGQVTDSEGTRHPMTDLGRLQTPAGAQATAPGPQAQGLSAGAAAGRAADEVAAPAEAHPVQ